jgi:hypothetical protein
MSLSTIKRVAAISGSLILVLVLATLAQQSTGTFSDSFHGPALDTTHWKVIKFNAAGNVSATTAGLQVALTARNVSNFFAETVWLTCRIQGDFSAQVDFGLTNWPVNSGILLGLGVRPNALLIGAKTLNGMTGRDPGSLEAIAERLSLKPHQVVDQPGGGDFYAGDFNGTQTYLTPTGRSSGKLRIARAGGQFTAYYWDGKIWVPLGFWSPTVADQDEWLAIQLWGFESSPDIQVILENFSITAGSLGCP